MKVMVSKYAGFCPGVRRAVELALRHGEDRPGTVATFGPLVHNTQMTDHLAARGIRVLDALDDFPEDTVVIRSHGVSPAVMASLEATGKTIVDATCPFVANIHSIVDSLIDRHLVIVGDVEHPEVQGILARARFGVSVVEDREQAEQVRTNLPVTVVVQTTFDQQKLGGVLDKLKARFSDIEIYDTICSSTKNRQREVAGLAEKCDLMLVIGGEHSANTGKLLAICKRSGVETHHIQSVQNMEPRWLAKTSVVGIAAGASTPDWIIREVVDMVMENNNEGIEEVKEDPAETSDKSIEIKEDSAEAIAEGPEEQSPEEVGAEAKEQDLEEDSDDESAEETAEPEQATEGDDESAEQDAEPELATESDDESAEEADAAADADEQSSAETTEELLEHSKTLSVGDVVTGAVVQVNPEEVLVDVGYKMEGLVRKDELSFRKVEDCSELVSVGQELEAEVTRLTDDLLELSVRKLTQGRAWKTVKEAFEDQTPISGPVVEVVKGGLIVDLGLRAFMPASLVDLRFVEDLSQFVGQTVTVLVIELERRRNKVIISRKAQLMRELEGKKAETLANLQENTTVKGVVRRLTNFGAFVDIGGIDGLIHISELAHHRVEHPSEVLSEDQELEVFVLKVDAEAERISLSLKKILPDPWTEVSSKFKAGDTVEGKVVRLADFGAFVELIPGVDGLVHVSQISDEHVAKPEDVLTTGQVVQVNILDIDVKAKRVSLSMRDAAGPRRREERRQESSFGGATIGERLGNLFDQEDE